MQAALERAALESAESVVDRAHKEVADWQEQVEDEEPNYDSEAAEGLV